MIKINNLTKRFGDLVAVDNLSLEIKKGEFFAFLGPNAAGKTTTIKLLTGLLKPTQGQAYIGGFDIQKDYVQAKALISYIPDFPFLYDKLTAREFLEFINKLYPSQNISKPDKLMNELLIQFGLTPYQDNLIEYYSHGMKQKLVFAAALLHQPQVMIIDEPMVGLDPHSTRIVKDILKEKSQQEGVTIFLSTHTLAVAEELADRIGIIDKGKLIALGTQSQLGESSGGRKLEDIFLRLTEEGKTDGPA